VRVLFKKIKNNLIYFTFYLRMGKIYTKTLKMKALITVGCMTDHGGIISTGDSSYLVEGKAVHLDGMTHFCPKCKVQARAIASNQGFMMVSDKSIVAVGDQATCGAKYLKISDLAVMSSGSGSGSVRVVLSNLQLFNNTSSLQESFASKQSLAQNSDKAYYKWWWGELESKNPETIAQEKRTFSENFDAMHKQYAYGVDDIEYEIDPKAWDVHVAMENLPQMIQRSVDKKWDIGSALSKMNNNQTIDFEWKNLSLGGDYYRTIGSKEWPLGRLACIAKGKLTKLGTDATGQLNFHFIGYLEIKKDTYSWNPDNKSFIKNIGIKVMGKAVELMLGKQTASKAYADTNYEMPTKYVRKFHFDYMKNGAKTPILSR
jgi:uncharacterized Zn-binding protein involved in type VI secretion